MNVAAFAAQYFRQQQAYFYQSWLNSDAAGNRNNVGYIYNPESWLFKTLCMHLFFTEVTKVDKPFLHFDRVGLETGKVFAM